jgi:hypothetical protein
MIDQKELKKISFIQCDNHLWLKREFFESLFKEKKTNKKRFYPCKPSFINWNLYDKPFLTEQECPFCKKGKIELIKIEPCYSGGAYGYSPTLHHVADTYLFKCSEKCGATFHYKEQWMYID